MPWWGWLIIGIFLMGAEMGMVDAAFYLIFIGFSAIIVGLLGMVGLELPQWGQWLLFSAIALISMVTFRQKLYKKLRGGLPGFGATDVGHQFRVDVAIPVQEQGKVDMRGSRWTAKNVGETDIEEGSMVEVVEVDGLLLKIEAR